MQIGTLTSTRQPDAKRRAALITLIQGKPR